MSQDLWGYGWRIVADYDPLYFPGWHPDGEVVEHPDDPVRDDLAKSWLIGGPGLEKRKPHIQNGADFGPAQPHENLSATEQWLRNMGHEFATRIHRAEPFQGELLRGMTVHPEWVANAARSRSVTLPLSSVDEDPTIASCYTVPDTKWGRKPGTAVFMAISPGAKAYPFGDSKYDTEYLTHGDFEVHEMRPATPEDQDQYGIEPGTTFLRLRQRSVPAPAGRTAARLAMPMPLPQGVSFHYHPTPSTIREEAFPGGYSYDEDYCEDFRAPAVEARINGNHAGYLSWHPGRGRYYRNSVEPRGEISDMQVVPALRRQGIATAMFDFAKRHEPLLHHSDWLSEPGRAWRNYEESRNKKARTMSAAVTVYTQPSCVQCDMTRKLLERMRVEHDTVDVTKDPDAHSYVTGLGYKQAPVVVVNGGEDHWSGFRPDRLKGLVE